MTRLATLLQSEDNTTKEMALSAIAATAVAAEIDFLPYTEVICSILQQLIFNTEPSMFAVRGRALECFGHVAVAIGDVHFARYFEIGMRSATEGVALKDDALIEHSYVFIANCAKVMKKAFVNYLPSLVPFLLNVISESEVVFTGGDQADEEEEEEWEDGDDEGGDYRLNVEEGFINSKKAALTAIGALAEHTKDAFLPYLQSTKDVLILNEEGAIYSIHAVVKSEALQVLQYLVGVACAANGIVDKPKFGEILQLPPLVVELTREVMVKYMECIFKDADKFPVSECCEGIIGLLQLLGLSLLHISDTSNQPFANSIMNALNLLLSEKAPCQVEGKNSQGVEDDQDDEDHDNVVIDSVTDLVGEMSKVLGSNFVPYFDEFHKHLFKFTRSSRPHTDRSMAIGCYAEVFGEIGAESIKYADLLLPIIHKGLNDPMDGVRRNAAFCIGILVQSTGSALAQHFLHILQWLHPVCIRPESQKSSDAGGADVDNALSAVARIINTAPTMIPISQVLPVMLAALPLRDDNSEGPYIYQCIVNLIASGESCIPNLIGDISGAFIEVLRKESNALDSTKTIAISGLKLIGSNLQYQSSLMSILNQIQDNEFKSYLQVVLN